MSFNLLRLHIITNSLKFHLPIRRNSLTPVTNINQSEKKRTKDFFVLPQTFFNIRMDRTSEISPSIIIKILIISLKYISLQTFLKITMSYHPIKRALAVSCPYIFSTVFVCVRIFSLVKKAEFIPRNDINIIADGRIGRTVVQSHRKIKAGD